MMWTTGCAVRSTGGLLGEGQTLEGDFEQTSLTIESRSGMESSVADSGSALGSPNLADLPGFRRGVRDSQVRSKIAAVDEKS